MVLLVLCLFSHAKQQRVEAGGAVARYGSHEATKPRMITENGDKKKFSLKVNNKPLARKQTEQKLCVFVRK